MIEAVLEADEQSRNSDIRLTQMVWYRYFPTMLFKDKDDKLCIQLAALHLLPREDNIKRIRAKIQNEDHKFLPTDQAVRVKRKISEEEWREYLGYKS